mgnify:FL=1
MTEIYTIYGSGGFAREVMPLLKNIYEKETNTEKEFYFIDDFNEQNELNGVKVLKA